MACNEGGIVLYVTLLLVVSGSCGRLVKLKSLEDSRSNSTDDKGRVTDLHLHRGRLVIGQNSSSWKRSPAASAGYQADMGWMRPPKEAAGFSEQRPSDATVEQILKMDPKVECSADSMKLQVQNSAATQGSLFLIDRGRHLSALPLSKLPSSCGYTVKSTHQDLVVVAPYDGCFVTQEEDNYVLPMLWLGLSVRMLCPQVRRCSSKSPTVTCYAEGMVVKMEWPLSEIYVKVRGSWEPLMKASQQCGFGIVEHSESVVVSVDYRFCLQKNDGMYSLEVSGDGKSLISCPISEPQPDWTDEVEGPRKGGPGHPQLPATQKPIVPQVPVDPPYPEQKPGVPQVPGYPPVDPQQPGQKPGVPQVPVHHPVDPPQPGQKPGVPQVPGYPPFFPPQPGQKPGVPQVPGYPPVDPPQPGQKPGVPQVPGYPPFYPPWPGQKPGVPQFPGYPPFFPPWPGQEPGVPQFPGYPPVHPTYPPQPGQKPAAQKPEAPPGKEHASHPQPHPQKQPEEKKPEQKPQLPQPSPDKPLQQPVVGQVPHPDYGHYPPKYIPYITPPPVPVGQKPPVPHPNGGGVVVPQSSLGMTPSYCVCPSGFGNCCPQIAFHQHHHHILPAAPGSKDVPPIYTGLPFGRSFAFPGLDDGSSSPVPRTAKEPTSTLDLSLPPDGEKQVYLQPPGDSLGANPEDLPVSPEQTYAFVDPQEVGQYWSYSPSSAGQTSGEDAVNPVAQHHPYMKQPPKEHQSSPENVNYASAPYVFSPPLQQQPRTGSRVQSWSPYAMLQDAEEQTRNISAPRRSPAASPSAEKHDQRVNASSESNSYLLLQRGPPGKEPHPFSESPFALRSSVHHGRDQGPSETSPEKLPPSREKNKRPPWPRGSAASFPNFWTRTISKQKSQPRALPKAFGQWGPLAEPKPKD